MASMLDRYIEMKNEMMEQMESHEMTQLELLAFQELAYRIGVLESCRVFTKSAPITMDSKVMLPHYRVVDAFMTTMLVERLVGKTPDEQTKVQRETARENVKKIEDSFRKNFSGFVPKNESQYKAGITAMMNTVLPAWIQYRNTYIML